MKLVESDIFLNGVFDEEGILRPSSDAIALRGIFDEDNDPMMETEGRRLTFLVLRTEVEAKAIRRGDNLSVGGVVYEIVNIESLMDGSYRDLIIKEI